MLAVIVACATSMLVSCSTAPTAKKPPVAQAHNPSAESLLKRMARAYGSARSYTGSGEVYDYHNGVRDSTSIRFRIHFVRPDRLRFEMTQNVGSPYQPERYAVIWSDGNWTYGWEQSYPRVATSRDVTSVIAQYTGVSGRAVHNIPSLLQANFGWQEYLDKITWPEVLGEEVFEKTDCYRIRGRGRGERLFEIWIGKSDYLIRKVRTVYLDFASEEIHRGITINQPVAPLMLSFTPPFSIEYEKP
jgi:hypothetical protein